MNLIDHLTGKKCRNFQPCHSIVMAMNYDPIFFDGPGMLTLQELFPVTEFRQPLQVQSHLEMPRILVQLGHTQRT